MKSAAGRTAHAIIAPARAGVIHAMGALKPALWVQWKGIMK